MLDLADREKALQSFAEALRKKEIDDEFLPYLMRLNKLQFLVPVQCCARHMDSPYGKWGYLSLNVDSDFLIYLERSDILQQHWLNYRFSQVPVKGKAILKEPELTEFGSISLGFAWDAKYWPEPAEYLTNLAEAYGIRHAVAPCDHSIK